MADDASDDDDRGPMLMATVIPLFAVALLVYIARIWTRLHPKYALTAADYTITVAMVAKSLSVAFTTTAIHHGFGKHTSQIPNPPSGLITVSNHLLGAWMAGVLVSGFARISIASLLLSITPSRRWKFLLWGSITLQIVFMLSYEIVQLVQCKSTIASQSRPSVNSGTNSQCMSRTAVLVFSYTSVSVCMLSDAVCSIIPLFVVWRLSRSTLEKSLVMVLMGSCLVATACGIPKVYYLATYDFAGKDQLWALVPEFFWCSMEEGIIIIAACAPLLKGPIERVLRRLGLPTFGVPMRDLNRISSVALGSKAERSWEEGGRRRWSLPSDMEGGMGMMVSEREVEEGRSTEDIDMIGISEGRREQATAGSTALTVASAAASATSTTQLTRGEPEA